MPAVSQRPGARAQRSTYDSRRPWSLAAMSPQSSEAPFRSQASLWMRCPRKRTPACICNRRGQRFKNGRTLSRACQGAQELVARVQYRLRLLSDPGQVAAAGPSLTRPRQTPTGLASPGSSSWTGCALLMPTGPSERRSSLSGSSQLPTRTARLTAMFAARQYSLAPYCTSAALGGAAIELFRSPRLTAEIS